MDISDLFFKVLRVIFRSLSNMKLVDLKISGAKDIARIDAPKLSNISGLMKKSLKEKIPIINSVEKGKEHANMFSPKLTSKVGFGCASFSSIE